jgi:hypothetical protein
MCAATASRVRLKKAIAFACLFSASIIPVTAYADLTLFSIVGGGLGDSLHSVDPLTGETTLIGNFGTIIRPDLAGLSSRPGDLQYIYSVDNNQFIPHFVRIDVTTGFAFAEEIGTGLSPTTLGLSSTNFYVDAVAISSQNPDVAILSAISGPFAELTRSIFAVSVATGAPLGPAIALSVLSLDAALAYSLDGNTLYGALGNSLYIINGSTGDLTLVGDLGVSLTGLAFNPQDGLLYGSKSSGGSELFLVDPQTASLTSIASFPTYSINSEGLAFVGTVSVPEPSSVLLVSMGLCLVAPSWRARRRAMQRSTGERHHCA